MTRRRRRPQQPNAAGFGVLAALVASCRLIAACGGDKGAGSGGYLATATDGVAYLQWTRTGDDATAR